MHQHTPEYRHAIDVVEPIKMARGKEKADKLLASRREWVCTIPTAIGT